MEEQWELKYSLVNIVDTSQNHPLPSSPPPFISPSQSNFKLLNIMYYSPHIKQVFITGSLTALPLSRFIQENLNNSDCYRYQ